jgi:hypothetical protein
MRDFHFFSEFLRGVLADGGRLSWGFCGEVVVECVVDVVSWWSLSESEREDSLLGFIFVGP